jgi:hypothetical protein
MVPLVFSDDVLTTGIIIYRQIETFFMEFLVYQLSTTDSDKQTNQDHVRIRKDY